MPYDSHRRPECNTFERPGTGGPKDPCHRRVALEAASLGEDPGASVDRRRSSDRPTHPPLLVVQRSGHGPRSRGAHEDRKPAGAYQVRDARITDVERITTMHEATSASPRPGEPTPLGPADLLRQLVYLPSAVVLVADVRRQIVGAVVLALRPSVRQGGYVATVDLLVVDPEYELTGVMDALVGEGLRSARNKGCVLVEAWPNGPAERARWQGYGFIDAGPRLERSLAMPSAART